MSQQKIAAYTWRGAGGRRTQRWHIWVLDQYGSTWHNYIWWYTIIQYIVTSWWDNSKPMSPTLAQHTLSAQLSCWSFVVEVIFVMWFLLVDYLDWFVAIHVGTSDCIVGSIWMSHTGHFRFDVLLSLRPWALAWNLFGVKPSSSLGVRCWLIN